MLITDSVSRVVSIVLLVHYGLVQVANLDAGEQKLIYTRGIRPPVTRLKRKRRRNKKESIYIISTENIVIFFTQK